MAKLRVNTDFVVESIFSTVSNLQQDLNDEEYINTIVFLEHEDLAGLESATTFI